VGSSATLNVLSLCAGVGGLDLGLAAALEHCGRSSRVVCFVEREAFAAAVLAARMEEGSLDAAPVWSDLRTFDGHPWRGVVDCIAAGYPCQPFSLAGLQLGHEDPRHLWPEVDRIIGEIRPRLVFLENVAAHLRMGFAAVRRDLQNRGYRVSAGLFSAAEVGASHRRERLFILAHRAGHRSARRGVHESARRHDATDADGRRAALAHARGERGRQGRNEQQGQQGASAPLHAGVPLAYTEHANRRTGLLGAGGCCEGDDREGQAAGEPGKRDEALAHASGNGWRPSGTGRQARIESEDAGSGLADADGAGLGAERFAEREPSDASSLNGELGQSRSAGLEIGRSKPGNVGKECAATVGASLPIFAPGPHFAGWPGILASHPHLAPAVEPGVHVLVDGASVVLDTARANQLRAAGNGVVPLCAALAFVTLARRAAII
jgi:DNA (cytosine-5)-methyltransferase 1